MQKPKICPFGAHNCVHGEEAQMCPLWNERNNDSSAEQKRLSLKLLPPILQVTALPGVEREGRRWIPYEGANFPNGKTLENLWPLQPDTYVPSSSWFVTLKNFSSPVWNTQGHIYPKHTHTSIDTCHLYLVHSVNMTLICQYATVSMPGQPQKMQMRAHIWVLSQLPLSINIHIYMHTYIHTHPISTHFTSHLKMLMKNQEIPKWVPKLDERQFKL